MRLLFFTLSFLSFILVSGQVSTVPYPVDKVFEKTTGKGKWGEIKGQKIKGKINGMGIIRSKDGAVYAGDIYDKLPNGKGMLMASPGTDLEGFKNGAYYVGRFRQGEKSGKGKVYNRDGELIYSGRFKNDLPESAYPAETAGESWFTELKTTTADYIGEMVGSRPEGFGMMLFPDGAFMLSNFVDGQPDGVNVYVRNDGGWISENVENGVSNPVSSSAEYAALESASRKAFMSGMSEALSYFSKALAVGTQAVATYQSFSNGGGGYGDTSEGYNSGSGRSSKSGLNDKSGDFSLSEQQSYNTAKSVYSRYDSQLAAIFAGNRSASASEIKDIQSKMRSLRQKWEAKGKSFPHYPNEDR